MFKLTIDRTKWLRGVGSQESALLAVAGPYEGKMCCLGFYCLANGMTPNQIAGLAAPCTIAAQQFGKEKLDLLPGWLRDMLDSYEDYGGFRHTALVTNLMITNDYKIGNEEYNLIPSEAAREGKIIEMFKELDVEVEFIN